MEKSCKISNHFHVKNIDENISAANYAFVQKWLAKKNQNIFTSHEKIFQCDLTNKKLEKSHGFFALWFEPSNSKCLLPYSDQSINTPKQINFQTVSWQKSSLFDFLFRNGMFRFGPLYNFSIIWHFCLAFTQMF